MAARSIGSVTIMLGRVAIPAKLFTAQAKKEISFNRLERATGARVKQQLVSTAGQDPGGPVGAARVLEAADLISGFEYTPDQFVTFTSEELKALELEGDPERIHIVAVVEADTFDPTHAIKANFLGPNKGGDRSYHLLATLLARREEIAIGRWGGRTRDELVVLRPHDDAGRLGLVLHEVLYRDEVRHGVLAEVAPESIALAPLELELGGKLLGGLSLEGSFGEVIAGLIDCGGARVKAAVARKVAGHQIVVPPPRADSAPLDLLAQLRASVPTRGPKKARSAPASRLQETGRRARGTG
jgi:DNA end-binding protein Ku